MFYLIYQTQIFLSCQKVFQSGVASYYFQIKPSWYEKKRQAEAEHRQPLLGLKACPSKEVIFLIERGGLGLKVWVNQTSIYNTMYLFLLSGDSTAKIIKPNIMFE